MRDLTAITEVVAREAQRGFLEKRALHPALISTALQVPGIADHALSRYRGAWQQLEDANHQPLGTPIHGVKHAAPYSGPMPPPGQPPSAGWFAGGGGAAPKPGISDIIQNMLLQTGAKGLGSLATEGAKRLFAPSPSFMERKDVPAVLGQQAIQAIGKGVSEAGVNLLKDMASKAMSAIAHSGDDAARKAILQQLRMEDSVLAEADDKLLMEAYHTMVRFAPTLSTDKNAVRNFLREAVMTGSGPNFATIKLLGETERTVTGQGRKD